jgi:hypothetical protein
MATLIGRTGADLIPMEKKSLRSTCSEALIIAHNEDTALLEGALRGEGLSIRIFRGPYTKEQQRYSAQIRCLINHANAWRYGSQAQHPIIVVEADFVPCLGFGQLPLPFAWSESCSEPKFGWLYSPGSILYGIDAEGFPHGHGNTTVAYVFTPAAAKSLLEFYEREMEAARPGEYRLWETYLGIFLRWEKGILNYIPIYQYGEHGGNPNKEHKGRLAGWHHEIRGWHQADVLWNRLSFLPIYARQSQFIYRVLRTRARLRGWARLLTLRFFDPRSTNSDSSRGRSFMLMLSIARLLGLAHFIGSMRKR